MTNTQLHGPATVEPGQRITLISTDDPWTRLRPGDRGTVLKVTGGVLDVAWDSGSRLSLIHGVDDYVARR